MLQVAANPELSGVIATGANLLPQIVIQDAFKDQYGKTLNFGSMHSAIGKLNTWYEDRGIFGQVRCQLAMGMFRFVGKPKKVHGSKDRELPTKTGH